MQILTRLLKDNKGQDLMEYALLAAMIAAAAGAVLPDVAVSVSTVFSQVSSVMVNAASQGGGSTGTSAGSQ